MSVYEYVSESGSECVRVSEYGGLTACELVSVS